jgi:hypothetical protein
LGKQVSFPSLDQFAAQIIGVPHITSASTSAYTTLTLT